MDGGKTIGVRLVPQISSEVAHGSNDPMILVDKTLRECQNCFSGCMRKGTRRFCEEADSRESPNGQGHQRISPSPSQTGTFEESKDTSTQKLPLQS